MMMENSEYFKPHIYSLAQLGHKASMGVMSLKWKGGGIR